MIFRLNHLDFQLPPKKTRIISNLTWKWSNEMSGLRLKQCRSFPDPGSILMEDPPLETDDSLWPFLSPWRSLKPLKRSLNHPKRVKIESPWYFYNFRSFFGQLWRFSILFWIWPNIFSDIHPIPGPKNPTPGFTYWLLHGHSVAISPVPGGFVLQV